MWGHALLCSRMCLFNECLSWSADCSLYRIWMEETALTVSSLGMKSTSMQPSASEKTALISFPAEGMVLVFLIFGNAVRCHSMLSYFVSGPKQSNQLSSLVTMFNRKSLFSTACFWCNCNNASTHGLLRFSMSSLGTQQTFQYTKVFINSFTTLCPMPNCTMISPNIIHQSSLTDVSNVYLLHSMVVVLGWLLQGRYEMTA